MMRFLLVILVAWLAGCGRDRTVTVVRGQYNQPTIRVLKAQSPEDADYQLYFHQGYEEASDRLVQMDLLRRMAQGKLSELLGPSALPKDKLNIAIGLSHATARSFEKLGAHAPLIHALNAFSDGVNRFIQDIPEKRGDLARLYRELARNASYLPSPWQPIDSVAMGESMAFFLSTSLEDKLQYGVYALYTQQLPKELAVRFDLRPIEQVSIIAGETRMPSAARTQFTIPKRAVQLFRALPTTCLRVGYPWPDCGKSAPLGSNNWVVSKHFAGKGATLLANDPHLPLTFPTMFYEMALDSTPAGGTSRVAGLNVPGAPGIMIGHNDHMAWGFTNLGADVDDVYFEQLSEDEKFVKFGDTWVPLEEEVIEIPVRMSSGQTEPHRMVLRWVNHTYTGEQAYRSHRRPIFSDHQPLLRARLATLKPKNARYRNALSYRWVGHEGTTELQAVFAMNRAKNIEEMRQAIRYFGTGTQNVVYADRDGNIGYMAHGKFPVRPYLSREYPPFVPIALHSDWDWDGFQTEIPQTENPVAGFIVTANNDPWGARSRFDDYRQYLSYGFSTGVRAKRITTLIEAEQGNLDTAAMQRIQFDHQDLLALRFIDQIRGLDLALSPKAAEIAQKLIRWNGESHRNRTEPILWQRVLRSLLSDYFFDSEKILPNELFDPEQFVQSHVAIKTLYHRLGDALSVRSPNATSDFEKAKRRWEAAFEALAKDASDTPLERRVWGEVSRLVLSTPLGKIFPALADFSIERDGNFDTVDVAHGSYGPNFRLIMKIAPGGITAVNVMPGGNYSPTDTQRLYKELLMWRDGKYRDLVSY